MSLKDESPAQTLDTLGRVCPYPLLLTKKAMEKLADADKHTFSKKYNHFYEFKDISRFDLKQAIDRRDESGFNNFSEIYSEKNVDFIHQFSGLDMDLKTVESISKKEIPIESFEYDGIKYNQNKANNCWKN